MRSTILIINSSILRSLIPEISGNIDEKLIAKAIEMEQTKIIRPILGYDLYEQILSEIENSTLTVANKLLLDEYLVMILSLSVQQRLLISSTFQMENTGVRIKSSDSSESATRSDISFISSSIEDDKQFFMKEMKKYICAHQSNYPKYYTHTDTRPQDSKAGYGFGFNIGRV